MPAAGRLGDKAQVQQDAHGCPGCPHPGVGPAIAGSANVLINGRPALRVDDVGIHAVCCGPNMWSASQGSPTVFINGKAAFRRDDPTKHCGGQGKLVEGSDDVLIGGAASGGSSSQANAQTSQSGAGGAGADGSGTRADGREQAASSPTGATNPASGQAEATPGAQPEQATSSTAPADLDTARWSIRDADGNSISGVRATFSGSVGTKDIDGGRGQVPGLAPGEEYALTVVGTTNVQGKLEDADGNPVSDAQVRLDRAWGPSVLVTTDAAGRFEANGFAQDEPFEATVLSSKAKAQGRLVDEDGKALGGVRARVRTDAGIDAEVITDAEGKWELEGVFPGEGYRIALVGRMDERR